MRHDALLGSGSCTATLVDDIHNAMIYKATLRCKLVSDGAWTCAADAWMPSTMGPTAQCQIVVTVICYDVHPQGPLGPTMAPWTGVRAYSLTGCSSFSLMEHGFKPCTSQVCKLRTAHVAPESTL